MSGRQLVRSFGVVALLTLLSRLTGFVRETAFAYGLGVSAQTDAYFFAYSLPNLAAAFLGVAVGKTLVPLFAAHMAEGREDRAWRLASTVFNAMALVSMVVAGAGVLGADLLVRWLAPGFGPEAHREAVSAARIMLPGLAFYCTGSVVTALLQARRVFALPNAAPVAQNGLLAAGALLMPAMGMQGLAWVTLGAIFLEVGAPLLALRGQGARWTPTLDSADLGQVGRLAAPLVGGALFYQLVTMVDWAVASTTGPGSLSALSFADRLRQLPIGLFGAAAATVIYPALTDLAARGRMEEFRRMLADGLYAMLAALVPCAAGLMLLRMPVVTLLFQRGAFDASATAATATALLYYAPGLVGLGVSALLSVAFYARKDTVTPVVIGLGGAAANMGLDLLLAPVLGHGGIALAGSLSSLGAAAAMYVVLARRLGGLPLPWGAVPGRGIWQARQSA